MTRPSRARDGPSEVRGPADVVVVIRDRVLRARVADGVRDLARPIFCERVGDVWPAIEASARAGRELGACILEPRDADGVATDAFVAALHTRLPAVPVLAYCSPAHTPSADVLAMARAGVSGLILEGYDDARAALRRAIETAATDATARHLLAALGPSLPRSARVMVEFCLLHGREPLSVGVVADALGVDRKTLATRLASAGLPEPRVVIAWSRLCLAMRALEVRAVSIERIALEFGYPSASALRNLCKRYTGRRFTDLRAAGGSSCMVHLFRGALVGGTGDGRSARASARTTSDVAGHG